MQLHRISIEKAIYCAILGLALGVRLYHLGAAPLSDYEAGWALQALQVAHGAPAAAVNMGTQPAYVLLTGAVFAVLGSSNFLARLWPALAGAFLVLLPALFRKDLGKTAAIIMAIGLAVDPGLVTVSRQAGGPMLALGTSLLALGCWRRRFPLPAGILGGLALLSGPAVITGALALVPAWFLARWLGGSAPLAPKTLNNDHHPSAFSPDFERLLLLAGLGVILVLGTFFFRYPTALGAAFEALPAFLSGWQTSSGVAYQTLIFALLVFQPYALIFGLVAAGRGLGSLSGARRPAAELELPFPAAGLGAELELPPPAAEPGAEPELTHPAAEPGAFSRALFLSAWAVLALVLALAYPARQVADLVWVLVPLWALAAQELAIYVPEGEVNPVSLGQAALVFIMLALFWYTLATLGQALFDPASSLLRYLTLVGVLVLGGLTTALVVLGWSWETGSQGLVWGVTAAAAVYLAAAMWGAAQLRPNQPQELWGRGAGPGLEATFMDTLQDLSNWNTGLPLFIDVTSVLDTPALRWALRDYPKARFVTQPAAGEQPSVILTLRDQETPALAAAYRGQEFTWWARPGWSGPLPPDIFRWLTYRDAPVQQDRLVLWARIDLFPDGTQTAAQEK